MVKKMGRKEKQLTERVAQLEREISELKSQMLALSLWQPIFIPVAPLPAPIPNPYWQRPVLPPFYEPTIYPIITCSTQGDVQ